MLDDVHIRIFKAQQLVLPAGTWDTQNVLSSYWRFYWNLEEGASLKRDAGDYPLEARRIHFVPAGVGFGCHNRADITHFYVHFDVVGIPRIAMREVFNRPLSLEPGALAADIEVVRSGTASDALPSMAQECRIKALLFRALADQIESLPAAQQERCSLALSAVGPVKPAIDHIAEHLAEDLSNALLADLCHLSEAYFIHQFRARVGVPPGRYIGEQRIAAASQMLLFTPLSIDAIAQQTGFSNRYYFSRAFARGTGTSPAAFRKARHV